MSWDPKYDEMLQELERDDRLGDHIAIVQEVKTGTWDDGRAYRKIRLKLPVARDAITDATLSEPQYLTKDQIADMPANRRAGLRLNMQLLKQLSQFYGIEFPEIEKKLVFGTKLGVKNVPQKSDDGRNYIRVGAFKPLSDIGAKRASELEADVPF